MRELQESTVHPLQVGLGNGPQRIRSCWQGRASTKAGKAECPKLHVLEAKLSDKLAWFPEGKTRL